MANNIKNNFLSTFQKNSLYVQKNMERRKQKAIYIYKERLSSFKRLLFHPSYCRAGLNH